MCVVLQGSWHVSGIEHPWWNMESLEGPQTWGRWAPQIPGINPPAPKHLSAGCYYRGGLIHDSRVPRPPETMHCRSGPQLRAYLLRLPGSQLIQRTEAVAQQQQEVLAPRMVRTLRARTPAGPRSHPRSLGKMVKRMVSVRTAQND